MTDLSLDEWLVLIGGLLILAILLNDHRQRRKDPDKLRMSLKKAPGDGDEPAGEDWKRDFPSGGARVVRRAGVDAEGGGAALDDGAPRGDGAAWDEDEWAESPGSGELGAAETQPSDPEAPATGGKPADSSSVIPAQAEDGFEASPERGADAPVIPPQAESRPPIGGADGDFAASGPAAEPAPEPEAPVAESEPEPAEPEPDPPGEAARDWETAPWADEPAAGPAAAAPPAPAPGLQQELNAEPGQNYDLLDGIAPGRWSRSRPALPPGVEPEIFLLHVFAKDEAGFSGADILQILLAYGMRFGEMDFFHRHADVSGRGGILFSAANMFNPGVFDLDAMAELRTRGLSFFARLPGPADSSRALQVMIETAQGVARDLDGEILDESRSAATAQTLEHLRERARDLERRLLARAPTR